MRDTVKTVGGAGGAVGPRQRVEVATARAGQQGNRELLFYSSLILNVLCLLWAAGHVALTQYFLQSMIRGRLKGTGPLRREKSNQQASILLALRGRDPRLTDTLEALANQNHDSFEVVIVIDSRLDPAWQVVEEFINESGPGSQRFRFKLLELEPVSPQGSLKCQAILQAARSADPESVYLVIMDADVVPHADWLSHLIHPLTEPTVGVTTGNQWFEPQNGSVATWIRSIWNAGALVPTATYGNPWAGSLAMRFDDVEAVGLLALWEGAAVDDGPIRSAMHRAGLEIVFVPQVLAINRERCSFTFLRSYIPRMLTWARLYDAAFARTVGYTVILGLLVLCWLTLVITASIAVALPGLLAALAAGVLANSALTFSYFTVRRGAAEATRSHGDLLTQRSWADVCRVFLLMPAVNLLHAYWMLRALVARRIHWRGITYRLHRDRTISMIKYQPFSRSQGPGNKSSL